MTKQELLTKDYLEIVDMETIELMKFKKETLVELIGQLVMEMTEMETKQE